MEKDDDNDLKKDFIKSVVMELSEEERIKIYEADSLKEIKTEDFLFELQTALEDFFNARIISDYKSRIKVYYNPANEFELTLEKLSKNSD